MTKWEVKSCFGPQDIKSDYRERTKFKKTYSVALERKLPDGTKYKYQEGILIRIHCLPEEEIKIGSFVTIREEKIVIVNKKNSTEVKTITVAELVTPMRVLMQRKKEGK